MKKYFVFIIIGVSISFFSCDRYDLYSISLWYKTPPRIIAVDNVANGYIHISDDNGATWKQVGPQGMWSSVTSSSDGMKLAATTSGSFIYTSTDGGNTWTPRDTPRAWSSIASSSDGTKLVAVVFSGRAYHSSDSGATWIQDTPANETWIQTAISSDGSRAVGIDNTNNTWITLFDGVSWNNSGTLSATITHTSIASSADGWRLALGGITASSVVSISLDRGATWSTPSVFPSNFPMYIASSSDGIKLAVAQQTGYIYTSTNGGINWTQNVSSGILNWSSIASSQDGTRFAAGVNGGYIYTSNDGGATWTERTGAGLRTWKNIIITK